MADKTEARRRAGQLAQQSYAQGDHTGWFEKLYAGAEENPDIIPWADLQTNPHLDAWLKREQPHGAGKTALVVGCGLGDDAEAVASYGFKVTAFDISPSAIAWCKKRFPRTTVNYVAADLFALPENWTFDLVVEAYTVQALPISARQQAIQAVAACVASGGQVLAIGRLVERDDERVSMPWPLIRAEFDGFTQAGLTELRFEDFLDANGMRRFRVLYQR